MLVNSNLPGTEPPHADKNRTPRVGNPHKLPFFPPMGNSSSSGQTTSKKQFFWRKRSWTISRPYFGCATASNYSEDSFDPMQETSKLVVNEKAVLAEHKDRQASLDVAQLGYEPKPPVVYSPTLNHIYLETDADIAFQMFLREYPGMYIRFTA